MWENVSSNEAPQWETWELGASELRSHALPTVIRVVYPASD